MLFGPPITRLCQQLPDLLRLGCSPISVSCLRSSLALGSSRLLPSLNQYQDSKSYWTSSALMLSICIPSVTDVELIMPELPKLLAFGWL